MIFLSNNINMAKAYTIKELACIELKSKKENTGDYLKFNALLDSGANTCIISKDLVNKLGLNDQIIKKCNPVRSFTGERSHFNGQINLVFSIGPHVFTHTFQVQSPYLATGTDALLGIDFLNTAKIMMQFGPNGPEMSLRNVNIPIVERQKRSTLSGNILTTYAIREQTEPTDGPLKQVKSAEYRKINPWTAVVTKVILPPGNWSDQVTLERSDRSKGFVVEDQLVTTRRNVPAPKAKCKEGCNDQMCLPDCPRVYYYWALCLVYNVSNKPIYISQGEHLASVEPQYQSEELTKQVSNVVNNIYEEHIAAVIKMKKRVERTRKRNKQRRQRKKAQRSCDGDATEGDENFFSDQTTVVEQNLSIPKLEKSNIDKSKELLDTSRRENYHNVYRQENLFGEANFLHLDPDMDHDEYIREYLKKHEPPIPLPKRKQLVKEYLANKHPDMDIRARDLLIKYSETVHLDNIPFVGTKTIAHRILYEGPVFWNRQYRTPHVLDQDIKVEIDRLVAEGIIEPSESQFNNAFLPVAKTDPLTGKLKLRLVIDFR